MKEFIICYSIIYLIEFLIMLSLVINCIKGNSAIDKLTVGDIIGIVIVLPATIILVPLLFLIINIEELCNIVIWRKDK